MIVNKHLIITNERVSMICERQIKKARRDHNFEEK